MQGILLNETKSYIKMKERRSRTFYNFSMLRALKLVDLS